NPAGETEARPFPHRGGYVEGVLHVAVQLAEALAFIHRQGICHRDLKPSNILLTPDGRPRLLDFNLSLDEGMYDPVPAGTVPYMAPEQLLALDPEYGRGPSLIDPRSDLFALGVILYELLAGVHPFDPLPGQPSSA